MRSWAAAAASPVVWTGILLWIAFTDGARKLGSMRWVVGPMCLAALIASIDALGDAVRAARKRRKAPCAQGERDELD
jgi:hypothetical protein